MPSPFHPHERARRFPAFTLKRPAFTLVELLVVIGIIALLVSILLPALTAARRQATAVKCAAHLREIGNAFYMYAHENRGYFPPAQLQPANPPVYNVDGTNFPQQGVGAYWFHFLQKYVTSAKLGFASSTVADRAAGRKTVLWGCPSWEGYQTSAYTGGVNVNQPGYGMSIWPTYSPSHPTPPATEPPASERAFITGWGGTAEAGKFFKQNIWGRDGSSRALVADSLFWMIQSQFVPDTKVLSGQANMRNTVAAGNHAFGAANTLIDAYRHGQVPPPANAFSFQPTGGKVAFNILYCDGHVATSADRTEAFRSIRMRFPG
jgi:prepilin-type N-terminal cleavage/methylation domain-containing protein/prepilin-type processing-associated H-X9-DG protein